jgi:hypothetical protein
MALRVADLNAEQRKVLRAIKRGAKRNNASPMELKAAIETALVEANLGNPQGGDADSGGWRQERRSLYSDVTNLDKSVDRFFAETKAVKHKYGNAGDLAAAVQRPAAQYRGRYAERSADADILRMGADTGGLDVNAQRPQRTQAVQVGTSVPSMMPERLELVQRLQRGQSSPLDFALGIRGLEQTAKESATPILALQQRPVERGKDSPTPSGSGTFKITGPNPERLKPELVSFAKKVAGVYGKPITGSDGTGHSYRTVNGNVSQHSTGNATDIPASGKELMAMGRAALIAAGMPRAQAMKAKGGLYNVGNHQIIFATNEGGNHHDHLHISAR